jgi:hypothetical protein
MIKIGTVEIPDIAGFEVNFNYTKITPKQILRTKNGNGIIVSRWQKLGISISGSGWIPDGLDGLDENVVVDIHCTAALSKISASNIITIPRTFRTDDYTPQGIAFINGEIIETPVALSGSDATLTIVPGATQYEVLYWPIVTSLISLIDRQFSEQGGIWNWSVEAEEK